MINIAIIGAGYWGSKIVEVLKRNPNVDIVQVIDIKNGQTINDIYSDIKTAVIATPVWDHLHIAIDLVNRGFDLYIEKPMCETAAEVQMLSNYAPNQVLMVGHIFLYHPALDRVKEHLPRIGTVKHVDSQRLNWGIYQTKTTPLLSLLPHDVSILNELFTDLAVTSASQRNFTDNIVPDWVSFNLTMGEATATVTGSWYWPERVRKLTIIGTHGSIVWDDALNQVHVFAGKVNERRLSELEEEIYVPDLSVTPLEKEMDHFVACVVTRQRPKTDVKNALAVAKILDAVKEQLSWAR
jgi:UDP-2-acetamido-3-amino-2,3-dideoxy-glucuronate N-acetyltransferase